MRVCEGVVVSEDTQLDCAFGDRGRGCARSLTDRKIHSRHAPFQKTLRGMLFSVSSVVSVMGALEKLRELCTLLHWHGTGTGCGSRIQRQKERRRSDRVCGEWLRPRGGWPVLSRAPETCRTCKAIACNLLLQVKTGCRSTR